MQRNVFFLKNQSVWYRYIQCRGEYMYREPMQHAIDFVDEAVGM